MPSSLAATADAADGFDAVAALIRRPEIRRLVVTGNGASYYVAVAMWLASLEHGSDKVEVVAVPAGLVARGRFHWLPGDMLLAISASGEFRDVIEAVEDPALPRPFALVTSQPGSTLAKLADAVAIVTVSPQKAITHTFAFASAVLACLSIWARVTADDTLARAVGGAADATSGAIDATTSWAEQSLSGLAIPPASMIFGDGPAWAGALEGALLIKEVSRLPSEGVESREGVTATMTGMLPGQMAVALQMGDDPFIDEARAVCESRGFAFLLAPGGQLADRRLAAITSFPAISALSAEMAVIRGWNPDDPEWIGTYYTTARRSGVGSPTS